MRAWRTLPANSKYSVSSHDILSAFSDKNAIQNVRVRHFKLEHSESTELCNSSIVMMVYLFIVGLTIIKSSGTSLDSDIITRLNA